MFIVDGSSWRNGANSSSIYRSDVRVCRVSVAELLMVIVIMIMMVFL